MPKINIITLPLLLISFFISNLKGQHLIEFFKKKSSPIEDYKSIVSFNEANALLNNRNSYTHKLDSTYSKVYSNNYKTEYIFDNEKFVENSLRFKFDDSLQIYRPESNNVLTYNKRDLLLRQTFNLWDGDYDNLGEENPSVKRQYYYNENDQLIRTEEQGWNDIPLNIIPTVREYEYKNELLVFTNLLQWSEELNDHIINGLYEYRYNEKDQLNEIITRGIHPTITRSYFDSIVIYYNEMDLLAREINYFQESNGDIGLKEEYEYTYNQDGNLIEKIQYEKYQESQQKWFKESRTNYYYDSTGKLISTKHYNRTLDDFEWGYWQEIKYKHDIDLLPQNTLFQRKRFPDFESINVDNSNVNMLKLYQESSGEVDFPFNLNRQFEYFYSPLLIDSVDDLNSQVQVQVSPNPTSNFLKFEVENYSGYFNVSIVDTQGKVILQSKASAGENISVSKLDAGVYIYRVVIGEEISSGKFVKVD